MPLIGDARTRHAELTFDSHHSTQAAGAAQARTA